VEVNFEIEQVTRLEIMLDFIWPAFARPCPLVIVEFERHEEPSKRNHY